jgi:hypothetical protein
VFEIEMNQVASLILNGNLDAAAKLLALVNAELDAIEAELEELAHPVSN